MQRENPDEDAAWQAIVDNYGERAELDPEDASAERLAALFDAAPAMEAGRDDPDPGDLDDLDDLDDPDEVDDIPLVDRFVPDDPPPVPLPPLDRLLAWIGVFGSPAVLLVFLVSGLAMPGWLGWLLVGGFVLGFCYLIIRMPRSPRDPWDDGARV